MRSVHIKGLARRLDMQRTGLRLEGALLCMGLVCALALCAILVWLRTPARMEIPEVRVRFENVYRATLVDINSADMQRLTRLPGIGEKIGQRIIDYREENGAFTDIRQLLLVPGIGEKMLDAIKDSIRFD